jgi:putative ABC transport system permease protein
MNGDRLLNASELWFRLLLRLYPADFRDEMGEALVETYQDRAREASSVLGLVGVWSAALRDSLRNGLGERARPAVSWRRTGDWGHDMEMVSRRFRRTPLFFAAVLGTLTVGLGTFAVVYTVVDKILIEPLPYSHPRDLYKVWAEIPKLNLHQGQLSEVEVTELGKAGDPIQDAAGIDCGTGAIPANDSRDAFHIYSMLSTSNLFDVLGVHPALGRGFRHEDGDIVPTPLLLSDAMWRRLGANPAIVGSPLRIGPDTHTVIGVMPANFAFGCSPSQSIDTYGVLNFGFEPNAGNWLALIRARPNASPEQVRQSVQAVGRSVVEREPEKRRGVTLYPVGLQADLVQEVRPALLALSFAAVFLLLVLTVNLASLLLARAAEREREFAVSRALGASGPAVVRATLFEGGLLGLMGGVTGALVGIWGTRLLVALGPLDLPRRETISLDWGVATVVIGVGALLGLVAAAVPAIWAARVSLASLMSASSVRGGAASGRMRRGLIVVQVALSLVLLSAGGLVVRSFQRLVAADPGFRPEGVLTLRLSTVVLNQPPAALAFHDRATAALRALPGVTSVSAATSLPLSGGANMGQIAFPGAPGNAGDDRDRPLVDVINTRAGYVQTMGMRLLAGRDFEATRYEGVHEALIDRYLAKQFFPDSSPIGATVLLGANPQTIMIVGVVEQARLHGLHQDGRPQILLRAEDYPNVVGYWFYTLRTDRDPRALIPEARAVIRQIERRIPVSQMRTMDEIVADARSRERISAVLIAGLALGALVLVTMGLFGMISGSVTRRRGELAVRLALGATHGRVIRLVVGEGARMLALGLLIGVPGIYVAGEALRGFLVGVSPFDAPTLAAVAIGLVTLALLACYLAARRVTAISPDRLLRDGG